MNIFYINGCSFVLGAGLPDCHLGPTEIKSSLGNLLNDSFNFKEYYNDSRSGCSNDRIRRKTIEYLLKNKNKWDDMLVVIGWTQFTRFEMIDEWEINNKRTYSNSGPQGEDDNYIQLSSGIERTVRFGLGQDGRADDLGVNTKEHWKNFYTRHYNIDDRYDKYLDNILYLQSFLKVNNIKYVMFDSLWSINDSKLANKFTSKYDCIDFDKWVWGEGRKSWTEYLRHLDPTNKKTRVAWNNDHPNEYGVNIWFDLVIGKIKELYG